MLIDDYFDDFYDDEPDYADPEPNRWCENGHAWFSGFIRGARDRYGAPVEADYESQPECPECSMPGYDAIEDARADAGWAFCTGPCRRPVAPPSREILPPGPPPLFEDEDGDTACACGWVGRCSHAITMPGGVALEHGLELRTCALCRTTISTPIPWVSPYPEDYIPGHPENAWGAFTKES